MRETKIFRESPFKALIILGAILGGCFLFFCFIIISKEMPGLTSNGLNNSAFLLVMMLSIFGGFTLLTFLVLSFQRRKAVKCDFEGCSLMEANFWNKSADYFPLFKWNEVKNTEIVTKDIDVADGFVTVYSFVIETDNDEINLMDLKTSSKSNIQGLINYVNQSTPHLPYIWVKDSDVGNRLVIGSIYGYSKVARN